MRDVTYTSRNFATLVRSGLSQPFAVGYIRNFNFEILFHGTGQTSDHIHLFTNLRSPVFLVNSRPSLANATDIHLKNVSTPSSEGTGSICRVPSALLIRTSLDPLQTHRCLIKYDLFY